MGEIRQAEVDEEGLRRFCERTARNLDSLDDGQWRILLETTKLRVLVDDAGITVKMAVPAVNEENAAIVKGTSRSSGR